MATGVRAGGAGGAAAGAREVVLFTDLANPTSNAIYPRLGFRAVHDACELRFTLSDQAGRAG